jgi:hypothetical protein
MISFNGYYISDHLIICRANLSNFHKLTCICHVFIYAQRASIKTLNLILKICMIKSTIKIERFRVAFVDKIFC